MPADARGPAVIHTGPADRAERWLAAMRKCGLDVRALPAIASQLVDLTPEALEPVAAGAPYRLVVVTSPRAAQVLPRFARWIAGARVAAIGPATARECAERGFEPEFVGSGGGRTFLEALAARVDVRDAHVLHPRGDLADDAALPELAGRGAVVVDPVVYRTIGVDHAPEVVRAASAGAAGVTFTSPSGVRSFCAASDAAGAGAEARLLFAATLGPATESAARKAGFRWRGISSRPEPDALARLLVAALRGTP